MHPCAPYNSCIPKMKRKNRVKKPHLLAMDLEGCLIPEIWIKVSESTGIAELALTTRDIKNYNSLMRKRLGVLKKHKLSFADMQAVIAKIDPLPGAQKFLDWARSYAPLIILSDTFYEFAWPLIVKLNFPTLFCHRLDIVDGYIRAYCLRSLKSKSHSIKAFRKNGFWVTAIGDSYNDLGMLKAAHRGIFLHASQLIHRQFKQFRSCKNYSELKSELSYIATEKIRS